MQIAVLACFLWPAASHAQITAPREAAQISYGPVSLYPSLQIVDAGRDSNVFDESKDPKEDYTFTIAPRALVVTRLGSNELMFATGGDYVWFQHFKEERSSNATYALRFNLSASRFKPFVGAERTRTHARSNAEVETRAQRLERTAIVGSNFNLTERTALTMSATVSDSTYAEGQSFRGVNLKDVLDRQEHNYSGGVRYALTPLTTLIMQGSYGTATFPGHLRDATNYTVSPILEFSPDAGIRGRVTAGIQRFKPDDPSLREYLGLTFATGVNWTLWGRTGFDLQGQRNISYSYKDTEPYYLLTSGRLTLTQKFIGPTDLSAMVERQFLSYQFRPGQEAGVDFKPDEVARNIVAGGVGIALGRGFRLVISAEHTVRKDPSDPLGTFNRNRLLSTVTIGS